MSLLASCRFESRTGRAVVLGATIAFGSCTLAGCDDARLGPKVPTMAATMVPELEMDEEAEPDELEPEPTMLTDADEGRLGQFQTSPGFTPDPFTRRGTTAGGPLDASAFDERCEGWVSESPDYVFTAQRPFAELALMVASSEDTTLVVIGPDGEARCADDEDGPHPVVRGSFAPGVHRVWVGTRSREASAPFLLALSELDDTSPSSLLQ
jgi:hypothetical protein